MHELPDDDLTGQNIIELDDKKTWAFIHVRMCNCITSF